MNEINTDNINIVSVAMEQMQADFLKKSLDQKLSTPQWGTLLYSEVTKQFYSKFPWIQKNEFEKKWGEETQRK